MLKGYYDTPAEKVMVMKEGESLSLGSCSLSFHMIPFGSYTWSGSSVNLLNEMASSLGFEVLGSGLSFPQAFDREKCNVAEIAALVKG